jgi:hypothetical protein
MMDTSLWRFLKDTRFFAQLALSGTLAACSGLMRNYGTAPHLAASGFLFVVYMFAAERIGLMLGVSPGWRPSSLAKFFFSAAKSYVGIK